MNSKLKKKKLSKMQPVSNKTSWKWDCCLRWVRTVLNSEMLRNSFLRVSVQIFLFFFTMFKWHPNGRITYKIQRQYEASSKTVNTPLTLLFQPQCVDVCQECISMSLRASQTIWYRQTERMDWWSRRGSDGGEKDWMLILQRKMRPFLLVMCLI